MEENIRIVDLEKSYNTSLYERLYTTSEYLTYMIMTLLLLTIFVVWAWEPMDLNNKEKFTICYLCCIGGDDMPMQKQEELNNFRFLSFCFVC